MSGTHLNTFTARDAGLGDNARLAADYANRLYGAVTDALVTILTAVFGRVNR